MKSHNDLAVANRDVGRHIDQVAEDLARLCVAVASHAPGKAAIEASRKDE